LNSPDFQLSNEVYIVLNRLIISEL